MAQVWEIYSDQLYFLANAFNIQIKLFVLMSNHFHLLASAPESNLPEAMNYFMRESSRVISFHCGRINQIYGGPYHPTFIRSEHHYRHAYKYCYRNPVEAGICERVEQYPYSTLSRLLGSAICTFPVSEDFLLMNQLGPENCLKWLNSNYRDNDREMIRKALKKAEFKFARDLRTKAVHELETRLS